MAYDLKTRTTLTQMVMRLFEHWKLSQEDQAAVLGLRSIHTIVRYRNGRTVANRHDLLERIEHLLAIHKSLRILFPGNRELVYSWVMSVNEDFSGKRPLETIILNGLDGLRTVRNYLELQQER